jgi:hypothetical protein
VSHGAGRVTAVRRSSTSACVLDHCAFQISMHVGSISAFTNGLTTVAQLLLTFNRAANVLAQLLCVEGSRTNSVTPALIRRGNRMFRYLFRRVMHSTPAHRRPIPTGALPASNSSYNPTTDNCTGLGWRDLLRDRSFVARQGQLGFPQPQQSLHSRWRYAARRLHLSPHRRRFRWWNRRRDNNGSANPCKCAKFIAAHTAAFAGRMTFARLLMLRGYFVRK